MVVFNDPVPVENPALQAVLMALEVRDAIGALTETWRRLGHDIGFGIGIAHGFATLAPLDMRDASTTPCVIRRPFNPRCYLRHHRTGTTDLTIPLRQRLKQTESD